MGCIRRGFDAGPPRFRSADLGRVCLAHRSLGYLERREAQIIRDLVEVAGVSG